MSYSPWLIISNSKKLFINKDYIHTTMIKDNAAKFSSFSDAYDFLEKKHLQQIFKPIQNKELK